MARPAGSTAADNVGPTRTLSCTQRSVSLIGNLALTTFFTGVMGLDAVASNVIAIACCSLVNFVASDSLVFAVATTGEERRSPPGSQILSIAALAVLLGPSAASAGPSPATVAGWQHTKRRSMHAIAGRRLRHLTVFCPRPRRPAAWMAHAVLRGELTMIKIEGPSVPDGKIHHWVGAIFVPGVTVNAVVDRLEQRAGHESESYEDVLASRLLERNGDRVRVFMKLRRTNLITVTLQHRTRGRVPAPDADARDGAKRGDEDRGACRRRYAARTRETVRRGQRILVAAERVLAIRRSRAASSWSASR